MNKNKGVTPVTPRYTERYSQDTVFQEKNRGVTHVTLSPRVRVICACVRGRARVYRGVKTPLQPLQCYKYKNHHSNQYVKCNANCNANVKSVTALFSNIFGFGLLENNFSGGVYG